jgi:hypothetical protein
MKLGSDSGHIGLILIWHHHSQSSDLNLAHDQHFKSKIWTELCVYVGVRKYMSISFVAENQLPYTVGKSKLYCIYSDLKHL